ALRVGLGGAAAIWTRSDDGSSSSGGIAQLTTQPHRDRSPQDLALERETKTRASKQSVARHRYARAAARSPRTASGGLRTETLRSPRPAAFHVPGAPTEPLDESALPVGARRR